MKTVYSDTELILINLHVLYYVSSNGSPAGCDRSSFDCIV